MRHNRPSIEQFVTHGGHQYKLCGIQMDMPTALSRQEKYQRSGRNVIIRRVDGFEWCLYMRPHRFYIKGDRTKGSNIIKFEGGKPC